MVIEVSPVQFRKAFSRICVVLSLTVIDVLAGIVPLYLNNISPIYITPSSPSGSHGTP